MLGTFVNAFIDGDIKEASLKAMRIYFSRTNWRNEWYILSV